MTSDGALAVGRDEDEVAGVGLFAAGGVDVGARLMDAAFYERGGVVVAEGCEEMEFGVGAGELEEGDAAAARGDGLWLIEVEDLAGDGQGGHRRDSDVLDVSDDGDAHAEECSDAGQLAVSMRKTG